MNIYKLTKAIRFKLEAKNISTIQSEVENLTTNAGFNLVSFVSDLNNFIVAFKEYLFYKQKNGDDAIKDKLTIKNEWLRQYARQEFYESEAKRDKNKRKQPKIIGDFEGLSNKIEKIIDEIDNTYAELADDAGAELNERARKAQTGLLLKKLVAKNALPFIISLAENTTDKNEKADLSIRLKRLGEKLQAQLPAGINAYLPEQSSGLPIAKASFNYYTINKNPVDFKQKVEEQQKKLKSINFEEIYKNCPLSKEIKESIKQNVCNFEELRQKLKNIKAVQKAKFNELMTQNLTFTQLQQNTELYLFKDITKQEFDDYKNITNVIEQNATKINQCNNDEQKKKLRSDLQKQNKERGSLINAANKNYKNSFKAYKAFANLYRTVAQKHGRILSTLKGIEKEKVESQLLNYWALILEENNQHKLVLIPKRKEKTAEGKAAKCYNWINGIHSDGESIKIYWFESLTLRSLRKLCFGNLETGTNTFNEHILDVLSKYKYYETVFNKRTKQNEQKLVHIEGEFSFKGDEQKIISFYKDILKSNYAQSVLNFPKKQVSDEIINQDFSTLDDFQIALEKICYRRYIICPKDIESELKKYDAQIFDITTLDLRNDYKTNLKSHTQIWKDFWSDKNEQDNFDIRLNPEITITYRQPKESRVKKYGKGSELFGENKNNRYLHPQFTLVTTISEHSNAPTKDLSFMTDKDFGYSVKEFNETLKKEDVKFALGIDNGVVELATLGLFLPEFNQAANAEKIDALKNTTHKFQVLAISEDGLKFSKQGFYKNGEAREEPYKPIKNPSYFLNKEQYKKTFGNDIDFEDNKGCIFEEKNLLTIDLTMAKVINGEIITNGDVASFLSLKLKEAQHKIYELNDHTKSETAKKVEIKDGKNLSDDEKQKVKDYNETNDQYNFFAVVSVGKIVQEVNKVFVNRLWFGALKKQEEIKTELDSYNTKQTISREELTLKINHLKSSLVANAIGVVDFLYNKYKSYLGGEGIIVKEGFDTDKVASDLTQFRGNIYRMLEWALYKKFQNYGLVPPIKNLLSLRGDGINDKAKNELLRFGNVGFVSDGETSTTCPICGEKAYPNSNETNYKNDKQNKLFRHTQKLSDKCGNPCGFYIDSKDKVFGFHSNDGVAGFNIAKRGFDNFNKETKI